MPFATRPDTGRVGFQRKSRFTGRQNMTEIRLVSAVWILFLRKILFPYACQSDGREKSHARKTIAKRSRDFFARRARRFFTTYSHREPNLPSEATRRTNERKPFLYRRHPSSRLRAQKNEPPAEDRTHRASAARERRALPSLPPTTPVAGPAAYSRFSSLFFASFRTVFRTCRTALWFRRPRRRRRGARARPPGPALCAAPGR